MPINEIDIEPLPSGQIGISLEIDQGMPGPANSLAIGTVTSGPAPSATITGSAPQQTLNLVLQKGDTGSQGLKGDKGEQGDQGLVYLGDYVSGNGYINNVAVVKGSDNNLYIAKASGGLADPVGNTAQWNLFLPKGSQGAQGAQGEQGPSGSEGPAGDDALWNYTGAYNLGASYAVGDVVTYNGELFYRKHSNGGNSGDTPFAGGTFWDLLASKGDTGLTGPAGPTGLGYASLTGYLLAGDGVGTGLKVFNTNLSSSQTAFTVGQRVRASVSGTPTTYIEGTITSFSGSFLTITSDAFTGSGSLSNVIITAAGLKGDTGAQGIQGVIGETGPTGPQPSLNVIDNAATSITISDADNNRIVRCTAATAVTVTVPSTLATGFSCMVIQAGAGQVTFAAGSGTTLNSFGSLLRTAGQHAPASLIRVGSGVYNLSGNLV